MVVSLGRSVFGYHREKSMRIGLELPDSDLKGFPVDEGPGKIDLS